MFKKAASIRGGSSGDSSNASSSGGGGGSGSGSGNTTTTSLSSSSGGDSARTWYSAIMSSPSSLWVLLGLSIAGILLLTRSRRKQISKDFGAFIRYLELLPPLQFPPPVAPHPLTGLTFAVKDIFDVKGFVTGFGCPDWERTHELALHTAPVVASLIQAGATCIGKTHMAEMAYSIYGQNKNYGTPVNPAATSRVPGGSSSGSAVAVAAELVDFALGTDTGGGVRIPAAFCGILGFRPSHGAVSCIGVVPVSQSLDTVGWFARDPNVLKKVGHILLCQPYFEVKQPRRVLIADDLFNLLSGSESRNRHLSVITNAIEKEFGKQALARVKLGEYFASKIPSLKMSLVCFRVDGESGKAERGVSALKSLRDAFQLLQGHEFKMNHEEWIHSIKLASGLGISEHVKAALETNSELVSESMKLRNEARIAMNELLMNDGILVIPTAPGPPPKLRTKESVQEDYEDPTFTLLCVASMSGCCQVSIPMGKHDGCPSAVSLIAKHGADHFLLDTTNILFPVLQKESEAYTSSSHEDDNIAPRPDAAEVAKEKGNAAFKKKDYRAAIRNYTEAIRCDEENATYYSNRAAAYLAMYSFHQAEADCCTAIDLDKKNIKAFLRRATAREFLGNYKEADEDFRQALVLEPTNKTAADGVKRLKKLLFE